MDDVNPIKSDPELQMLIRKLDRVNKYKTFQRWKDKFLAKLEDYLYEKGMQPAEKACDALEDRLKKLVMKTTKLLDYIHKGDLGEDKKTVKASLALNEMCNSLESARKEIEDLIPALKSEEKRRGYSKFHLGAALIRQGFHQYVSMKAVEDAVKEIGERLENVADKQQHELFHFYHVQVQRFCDVMADLSLYTVMMKCIQLSEAPDESESDEPEYIQIMVKTEDGKKLPMEVEETETVGNVKEATEAGTGIPADKQVMKFRGAILGNNAATMKELKVEDGAVFFLEPLRIPIVVRTPDGKEIPLTVDPNIYMTDLKRMLEPEAGIPAKNQQLSRNGQDLNDRSKTLDDYGIEAGAILDVEPKSIKVNIEMPDGEKVELEISPSDDAEAIKEKIAAKTGMPVPKQVLKHNGDEMPEGTTAKGLGVKEGDTIQVEVHKIPIKVNRWEGNEIAKVIELFVDPTVYVTELKRLLEPESGIPAKKQCLTKGGEELSDRSKTLEAYGIEAGSILDLEPVSITLSVEMPDGEKVEIEVLPSDTTDVIKDKIAAKTGMPIPKQVLKHNDAEMPPTATAKDQNLKEGSEIKVELFKIPIKVNQWDGKEISKVIELFVDPTVYITEVKRMLEPESGIPAKNQCLFKSGQELGDHNKSLKDYGIEAGAVLDLEPASMQVTVEMPDGEKISIEVLPSDTTDAIKDKIAAKTGMPIPKQVLKHNDAEMQPDATAKEQGLKEGSEIKVELFKIPITVKNWDGKEIELSVEPTETLENVKRMLEPETGIAPDNQMLRLGGEELTADRAPISDQGVVAGSVLDLEPKRINVNVEMPDGEKIPISVALADTADDVKERIAAKTGMEPKRQVVKHNDQELPGDGATVKDMGIKEGSDLKVDVFKIPVKVRNWDGTTTDLMVDPTEDLASVKKQLEPETGISPDNQRLFMDDKELVGDDKSAEDHGITPGAVLDLEPKSIKVSVDMPDGQSVEVDVAPSDDIDAIKKKIEEKTGMEAPRQVLKKGDDILPAGKTVKDMGIKEGDKLSVDINKIPVTVKNWDGSEFEILVEPTEGMASVKAKIEPESGIPVDNQKVSLAGKELEDDSKSADENGIKPGSVLDLEPKVISVNVEMPDGEKVRVDVPLAATSDDVKKIIADKTGMEPKRQVVKHNDQELPGDGATVKDMGIKEGSDLKVDVFKIPVKVRNWDGTTTDLMVDPTEDLASVKKQLEPETGISPDNQRLFMDDKELVGDDKSAEDHGITPGAVLDLEPKSIKVSVDMPDGQSVEVDVAPSDDIDAIKKKIEEKTGMEAPRQVLKKGDDILPAGKTVKDMGIKEGDKLSVDINKIPVTVKNWDGSEFEILVEPTEGMASVKAKIEPESGIPADNQKVTHGGKDLDDNSKTVADCGIKKGDVLEVEPKIITVNVEMPDGETHAVSFPLLATPDDIKKAIEEKTGMSAPRQVVKHNGVELPKNSTAKKAGLKDGSTLQVEVYKIPVTVKNWDGTQMEVALEPTETLADLKKALEPESEIPADNQVLRKGDTELEGDDKPISDLGISPGTVLDLEPRSIALNVEMPDGEKVQIDVPLSDTKDDIKRKIAEKTGMDPIRQVVKHDDKELPGKGATVKDMGIKDGSDLAVEVFKIPVTVKSWDGKTADMMIDPTEALGAIKKQLEPEFDIPAENQSISMNGEKLADDAKTARDHGIKAGSILDLEPNSVKVAVTMPDGETVEVELSPSDDGAAIKKKIEDKTGMEVPRQVLKHDGVKVPNAGKNVGDLGLRDGSKLEVEILKVPITVKNWDGNNIEMMVEPTEKLADIKKRLEPESGIKVSNQVLSLDDNELSDNFKTATENGIKSGTVLELEPRTINVNAILPDGKSHRVEISPRDDTEGIKMKIEQQTGMEAPRQVLSFNGKKLPKRGTAKDMGIREDSDINVDIFKVPVIVNNWDGKRIEIMVDPLAKLSEMKKDLEPESGIKVSNQALFLGEQELTDDNKRAKAYGIEGGTVLDLEPRFIGISVEMPSGETISFEVKPSSTGDDIKGIVAEKTGVAAIRQVLHFGKKEVLADYTVKGMGIKNESTLKCELYKIPITVETKDGKTIPMKIEPIETLDGLKGLLEKDSGLPAKKQVISFIEKELEHGKKTMTEYGVKKGSVLFLEPKDDPIVFVDVKCGVLFGVDRDEVIEQGVLTMKGDSKLEFVETEAGSFAKEKMLKAMLDSPNLGVKPQIVVEKVEVEDYDLAEAENVKSKWGVQLKKTQKAKKGDEFIFVDVKTGAVGLLDRKKCIDMKFINLVGYGKDETLKEAEHTTKIRDKYVLQIRNIFGIKTAN